MTGYTISWPVPRTDSWGWTSHVFLQAPAGTLAEAQEWAASQSLEYGSATITDRDGLVAKYVSGQPWAASKPVAS